MDGVRVVEGRALRAALQRWWIEPLGRDLPPRQRLDVRRQARPGRRGARARNPDLAGKKWFQLRQADVIATVAARHPDLTTDAALQKEGMQNLRDYALGDPVSFAAMGARKVWRLWGGYTLGTYRNPRTPVTVFHLLLVAFGLVGLVAGFVATRGAAAMWLLGGVLLYVSAINALLVSEARHNLTVMPIVVATGAAGVFLAATRLRERRAASPERRSPRGRAGSLAVMSAARRHRRQRLADLLGGHPELVGERRRERVAAGVAPRRLVRTERVEDGADLRDVDVQRGRDALGVAAPGALGPVDGA